MTDEGHISDTVRVILSENTGRLRSIIELFGKAPDSQLEQPYKQECADFSEPGDDDAVVLFARNLRDRMMHGQSKSKFAVEALMAATGFFEEEEAEAQALRLANLGIKAPKQDAKPEEIEAMKKAIQELGK